MNEQDVAVRDRLRRAEGQLRGIIVMLESGRSCEEIMTQLLAVRSAVDHAAQELITNHIDQCVDQLPPEELRKTLSRAVKLLSRVG